MQLQLQEGGVWLQLQVCRVITVTITLVVSDAFYYLVVAVVVKFLAVAITCALAVIVAAEKNM